MTTPYMGQPGGTGPYPLQGLPAAVPPAYPPGLTATTGPAGFRLVNGTPSIISWTAPGDGQLHRVLIYIAESVTTSTTGGEIAVTWTTPDGATSTVQIIAASQAAPQFKTGAYASIIVAPGSTVTLGQATAMTAGAAQLWAELWAS